MLRQGFGYSSVFGGTEVCEDKVLDSLEVVNNNNKNLKPEHFDLKFGSLDTHFQIWGKMTKR